MENISCASLKFLSLKDSGTSLLVQWLRLRLHKAGNVGFILGQGTKIPPALWPKKLKNIKQSNIVANFFKDSNFRRKDLGMKIATNNVNTGLQIQQLQSLGRSGFLFFCLFSISSSSLSTFKVDLRIK